MKIKKHLTFILLSLTLFSFFGLSTAEAKRFGMGGSYGYSKKIAPKNFNRPATPKPAPAAQKPNAGKQTAGQPQRSGASRWLGPLAGLAAGGLLAAMLFGDGFEGLQIMDLLLFGLIAFGLFMLFKHFMRSKAAQHTEPANASATQNAHTHHSHAFQASEQRASASSSNAFSEQGSIIGSALSDNAETVTQPQQIPEWFDEQSFLDAAKHNFIKVQQAWDNGDLETLKAYCSPKLFEDLKQHIKAGENHTEVDTLYAEIADMAIEDDDLIISVRFSGFIKEEKDGDAHAFNDIWHLRRKLDGSDNWKIIGIQPGQPA